MSRSNRREFVTRAVAGVATVGMFSPASTPQAQAQGEQLAAKAKPKVKVRIGVRFNDAWLHSKNDDDLRFFKQIGVDYVDIELVLIKGYKEYGIFSKADLRTFVDRLAAVGLRIERANALGPQLLNAHLNRPEGQKEIDNLKRIGEMVADAGIPVLGIQACQASQHVENSHSGWVRRQGRGGYGYWRSDNSNAIEARKRGLKVR